MYTFTKLHDRHIPTIYPNPDSYIEYSLSIRVECNARWAYDRAKIPGDSHSVSYELERSSSSDYEKRNNYVCQHVANTL